MNIWAEIPFFIYHNLLKTRKQKLYNTNNSRVSVCNSKSVRFPYSNVRLLNFSVTKQFVSLSVLSFVLYTKSELAMEGLLFFFDVTHHLHNCKGGSRHKNWCMARVLSFLIRYFSNYYTLHRSDLAAWAAPLDPRLNWHRCYIFRGNFK